MGVAAKGVDFAEFKSHFGADDRGFGYIKITVRIRSNSSIKDLDGVPPKNVNRIFRDLLGPMTAQCGPKWTELLAY